MDKSKLISFIAEIIPIPRPRVEDIAETFEYLELKKNAFFIKAGLVTNTYMYLETGFIRAFTFDTEGDEVTTAFYSAHQVVFEVSSFFQKIPSRENYQAMEDCTGWFITYDQLQTLFHTIPEFREFGRMILVKGYSAFKQRTLSLIQDTAEQRYEILLLERPEVFQKVPLKYIASYLGITDTSLSRIRRIASGK